MLARGAGHSANDANGVFHAIHAWLMPRLARFQSTVNALAILGIAGSLMYLAVSIAASLRPHLRGIID